jgi:uncharacterized protein YbjT (DUF2867 family)
LAAPARREVASRTADIPFDWDDQRTWAPALAGVDAVYLTYYPDLAVPGSVDAVRGVTELAERAGVRRIVLLSGRNEVEAQRAEDVVKASGLQWTIVRCAFFAQNFSEGAWLDEILAGRVALPVATPRSRSWMPTTSPTSWWLR